MTFCNNVDEKFQPFFVIDIDYCITEACITIVLPRENIRNNCDIFYDEMVLIFFYKHHWKASCKKVDGCYEDFCMVINNIRDTSLCDASTYVYDNRVLKSFINTIAKPHVKRLSYNNSYYEAVN